MGHLAALCIGYPESNFMPVIWNLGLVGIYISGLTSICASSLAMMSLFSGLSI